MKKIILSFCLVFLASCSSSSSSTSWLTSHDGEWFTLQVPATWVVIDSKSRTLPEPKQWKIVLAIASPEVKDGFSNNLVVLQNTLNYKTDSKTFSDLNNRGASTEYYSYKAITNSEVEFADGENSSIYTFEAQYNSSTPKLTFLQTGRVCDGNNSFFLTMALPMNITDTAKYEDILKTFECK